MRSKSGNLTPKEYAQNLALAALTLAQHELREHLGDGHTEENESFVKGADTQLAKIMDRLSKNFDGYDGGETNEDWTRDFWAKARRNRSSWIEGVGQ